MAVDRVIEARTPAEIGADDFARRFSLRTNTLMWLLGAGASAAAGIPTAGDMIWEFKQRLYVSQKRTAPQTVADLSSPAIRARLQGHIDSSGKLPAAGSADEYAALFEAVFPAEGDRRAYLDSKISGAKPSYGHLALATLMHSKLASLVWTTNFDPLVADACAKVYDGTGHLTTVALDAPELAQQTIHAARWPVEVKLHGDFRSRRLKNTSDELRLQDEKLRRIFIDSCRRMGLIAVGYSGRDTSVMDALSETLREPGAFPGGLFWLHRGEDAPAPDVVSLLSEAAARGVEAALVSIENFDEIMRDLVRLREDVDRKVLDEFAAQRRRWSAAPIPAGQKGWPVIRLNALPVMQRPTVCRRVVCTIGGYAEMGEAVAKAGVEIIVARTKAGVLAFGSDADVRKAFDPFGITEFDLHTIEQKRMRNDTGERGLLNDALTRAITRQRGLKLVRKGSSNLLAPTDQKDSMWSALRKLTGSIGGTVAGQPDMFWQEGVGLKLDWANDGLWLLAEPRIVFTGVTEENKAAASDFARERTVRRYNRQLNDLIAFWSNHLASNGAELRALGIGDGVDASFKLSQDTGYSRRIGA